jgi:hypothetical protein
MPSPIPGMDPYLEHPALFPGIHNAFINYLCETLNQQLPSAYYAATANRVWVQLTERVIEPDVNLLHQTNGSSFPVNHGGIAVANLTEVKPVTVRVPREEMKETFVEVYAAGQTVPRLVAVVELLSRANKTPKSEGRKLYRSKQREVCKSSSHLLEIDLLRYGTHTTVVPLKQARAMAGPFDYHACLRQGKRPGEYLVYPVQLGQRLPVIGLPLLPDDGKVLVDLQAVLDRAYDMGRFRQRANYTDPPPPPTFSAEQTAWLDSIRRERGLLPAS